VAIQVKRQIFVNADENLARGGNIARVLLKDIKVVIPRYVVGTIEAPC